MHDSALLTRGLYLVKIVFVTSMELKHVSSRFVCDPAPNDL